MYECRLGELRSMAPQCLVLHSMPRAPLHASCPPPCLVAPSMPPGLTIPHPPLHASCPPPCLMPPSMPHALLHASCPPPCLHASLNTHGPPTHGPLHNSPRPPPLQGSVLRAAAKEVRGAKAATEGMSPVDMFVGQERAAGLQLVALLDRSLTSLARVLQGQDVLTSSVQVGVGCGVERPGGPLGMHGGPDFGQVGFGRYSGVRVQQDQGQGRGQGTAGSGSGSGYSRVGVWFRVRDSRGSVAEPGE